MDWKCLKQQVSGSGSIVSSHTPTIGTNPTTPPIKGVVAIHSGASHTLEMTNAVVYHPRRSSLVSWTVRAAQVADRIVTRAFPASGVTREPNRRLVEKTLNGLDRCCRLLPAHQGVVAAERVRLRIQQVFDVRRQRYRHFERRRQMMQRSSEAIIPSGSLVHLNPVCRWVRISDEPYLEQHECLSGSVLFFRANNDIRGLSMNLEGQALINELADYQPCTILQWAQLSSLADSRQLRVLVRHLADIGLVAWGDE